MKWGFQDLIIFCYRSSLTETHASASESPVKCLLPILQLTPLLGQIAIFNAATSSGILCYDSKTVHGKGFKWSCLRVAPVDNGGDIVFFIKQDKFPAP